ncbi:hypothetical protein [Nocardia wallacei]|uniref:hypothetical protein n=1 Tax=Nocardia wallacei TaxID=480035 RepID=UPI002457EB41|nr:hypothetical protein [Nocardia wallacei]
MTTANETAKTEAHEEDTASERERAAPDAGGTSSGGGKRFSRRVVYLLAAVVVVLIAASSVLAYQWHSSAGDLAALRQQNADREHAARLAEDYTLRSLTYDYNNLPGFFDGVQRDTSEALRKRYTDVHDTLAKIMTEAQVVATGQVVATAAEPTGNDQYTVTVFATQRTQNIQQPEPATTPNLLSVTVAKSGSGWQVTDYGPK